MRDLFLTTRSFVKRLGALLRYRQAVRDMNKYPDATTEELSREDTCIICREEMRPWDPTIPGQVERSRPKKLPCGHILHFGCLKSWLERQQVCPTCRSSVVMDNPAPAQQGGAMFRIGLNFPNGQNQQPPANGPAPGGGQAPQAGQNPQQNGQDGGVRMFNLGPLRLGFAQGGARDLQEMAQRMGMPADMANPQVAPQQQPLQPRMGNTEAILDNINAQLTEVSHRVVEAGQQVQQDMQTLHNAEAQLQMLNLLFQEMARLNQLPRSAQQQPNTTSPGLAAVGSTRPTPSTSTQPQAQPHPQLPHLPTAFPQQPGYPAPYPQIQQYGPYAQRFSLPTVTRHGGAPYAAGIPAGSSELPEGVVIPPGWSLLPLQRLDGPPAPAAAAPPSQPQAPPTANNIPEILQNLAQQTQNAHAAASIRASTSHDATSSTANNLGNSSETSTAHPQQASAGPSTSDEVGHNPRSEPPPVTAPTPVMPNWGGRAQLFGGGSGTFGYQNSPSSSTPVQQEETVEDSSGEPVEQRKTTAEKGKARAVTVEEAEDDEA